VLGYRRKSDMPCYISEQSLVITPAAVPLRAHSRKTIRLFNSQVCIIAARTQWSCFSNYVLPVFADTWFIDGM